MRARALLAGAISLLCVAVAATPAASRDNGPDLAIILSERPATTLAAYRLFRDVAGKEPNTGVVAYDLPTPLFSDYATKRRYVFLPPEVRAQHREDGAIEFPVGAVLIKTFEYPADMRQADSAIRTIETRLFIRGRAGWTANTYVWNADGTEARLQVAGASTRVTWTGSDGVDHSIDYAIPNRNQCKGCHSVDGELAPIGPTAVHFAEPDRTGETELARWTRLGLLDGAPQASTPAARGSDAQARAYLDINCAHCHNPRGPANTSGLDLRATQTDAAKWGLRKRPIAAGRASADLSFAIDPGHPERSILLHRMESTDPGVMMPELGRTTVHAEGVALVRAWIAQMDADGRPRQN
jgi:uncharacterized repeat protein (TIGR03806 family)